MSVSVSTIALQVCSSAYLPIQPSLFAAAHQMQHIEQGEAR